MTQAAKVKCQICEAEAHFLEPHLNREHGLTKQTYLDRYPGASLMSEAGAKAALAAKANAENPMVQGDIKKLFGTSINKGITQVPMYAKPQPTTPEIDPDYVFEKESLMAVLYVMMNGGKKRAVFTGPTGCGKTTHVEQVAARLNWGWTRINGDQDLGRSDFIGTWKITGSGEMTFVYGPVPIAMREGHILCLDEDDALAPGVKMALQSVLEGKALTITETGEVIHPHPNFRLFATNNTGGHGDASGLYSGTQVQNFAATDRWNIAVECDYPGKNIEAKILKNKTGIDDAMLLDKMLEVAKLVRAAFKKGDMVGTMSTRTLVNVGQLLVDFGDVNMAYKLGFVNKLNPDDRTVVNELIQRVWGGVA